MLRNFDIISHDQCFYRTSMHLVRDFGTTTGSGSTKEQQRRSGSSKPRIDQDGAPSWLWLRSHQVPGLPGWPRSGQVGNLRGQRLCSALSQCLIKKPRLLARLGRKALGGGGGPGYQVSPPFGQSMPIQYHPSFQAGCISLSTPNFSVPRNQGMPNSLLYPFYLCLSLSCLCYLSLPAFSLSRSLAVSNFRSPLRFSLCTCICICTCISN